jgi:uncharacterized membrane protein YphA (DoxX/SURF4 family)
MDGLLTIGRFFFAIAMALFGVQYFIYASAMNGPIPGPPWTPGAHWLAWLTGFALIAIGSCIASGKIARFAATILGAALLLNILFLHAPGLLANIHNPGPWTSTFELLALCGGAFVLAKLMPADVLITQLSRNPLSLLATAGRLAFAIALVVFAVQHFLYARFIATLIPVWIPGHLFWAYFVGVAFVGAALAIAANVQGKIAATLLGTMFILWVFVLHLPRVAASPRNGNEVTSLCIALAMSGASFILAASPSTDTSV